MARRIPKRGFTNPSQKNLQALNLDTIQFAIDTGKLDGSGKIDMAMLEKAGVVGRIKDGVKLLSRGSSWFQAQLDIEVTQASEKAIEVVEAKGGKVTARYFNRLGLRAHRKPEKFPTLPKQAMPSPKDIGYYQDPHKRGYLADPDEVAKLREENRAKTQATGAQDA